jgi:hypothetical protein
MGLVETLQGRKAAVDSLHNALNNELFGLFVKKGWRTPDGKWIAPVEDPNFKPVDAIKQGLLGIGFKGPRLDEAIQDTIVRLFYNPGSVTNQYDITRGTKLDLFIRMAVKRRGRSEGRDDTARKNRLPSDSITQRAPELGDAGGGVSQEHIPGGEPVPGDDVETRDYMRQTFENVKSHLSRQRFGDLLVKIFELMAPPPQGKGMNADAVAAELTRLKVPSGSGATTWGSGMLNGYIRQVRDAFNQYIEEEDRGEGGEGTLKKIRQRDTRKNQAPMDPQNPQGPQNPQNPQAPSGFTVPGATQKERIWTYQGQQYRVRVKRQGEKNTRIEFAGGVTEVVDNRSLTISGADNGQLAEPPAVITQKEPNAPSVSTGKPGPRTVTVKLPGIGEVKAVIKRKGEKNSRVVLEASINHEGQMINEIVVPNSSIF